MRRVELLEGVDQRRVQPASLAVLTAAAADHIVEAGVHGEVEVARALADLPA
jgi:hypothetical protein